MTESGNISIGYRERWWTLYPRIGFENTRQIGSEWILHCSTTIGLTALTQEHISLFDVELNPKQDIYVQMELRLQKKLWYISLMLEDFGWQESNVVDTYYQPESHMVTLGMLLGYVY